MHSEYITYFRLQCTQKPGNGIRTLQSKYRIFEATNKKFLNCNFVDFKMTENKSIIGQVNKILGIINQPKDAKINLPKSFKIGVIISRPVRSWND